MNSLDSNAGTLLLVFASSFEMEWAAEMSPLDLGFVLIAFPMQRG